MAKFCVHCGAELLEGQKFCPRCGKDVNPQAERLETPPAPVQPAGPYVQQQAQQPFNAYVTVQQQQQDSPKSKTTAALLCFFLGALGLHRFYVGKVGTGVLWLLTAGVFGIGALVDFFVIIFGNFKDGEDRVIR